jgi:dTDP-4-amino-4,6-dideoxygalactose transaminase
VVVLPEGADRDRIRRALTERGVQTSVHYPPIHAFSAYADGEGRSLPRTDELAGRILTLPLYPTLPDGAVRHVCDSLVEALQDAVSPEHDGAAPRGASLQQST